MGDETEVIVHAREQTLFAIARERMGGHGDDGNYMACHIGLR